MRSKNSTYRYILESIYFELYVLYRLICRDIPVSILSGSIFSISALKVNHLLNVYNLVGALCKVIVYFVLYIYNFCMMNQIVGIEEDKINKPDRPLASGLINLNQAKVRLCITMILFPTYAYLSGDLVILYSAIGWQIIMICYNYLGFDKHWFNKNIVFITTGTFVQLTAAYEYGNLPLNIKDRELPYLWILYISLAFGISLNLQDLRDVIGDQKLNRQTLPVLLGQEKSRKIIALIILCLPISLYVIWKMMLEMIFIHYILQAILVAFNSYVALKTILGDKYAEKDHSVYMVHCYYFCILIGTTLFVL